MARRAAWSFGAQAISSTSNFILTLSILAAADRRQFATFSFAITTYMLVSQLARSASALPLMILYSDHPERESHAEHQAAVGVAVLVGLVSAVALLGLAVLASRGRVQLVILGLAIPLLLFQDAARHLSFSRSEPQVAAFSDGLWLALQVAGSLAAWRMGWATVPVLITVWAASGTVAGLVAGARLRVAPLWSGSVSWLRSHRALCGKLLFEFVVNSGSFYLLLYGLAFLAGIEELGDLRAAQTLIGPVIVVLLAGNAFGIPESVRVRRDLRRLRRLCLVVSTGLAAATVAWSLALYALLPVIGPRFFSSSWETARPLIPMLSVFAAAVGISIGGGGGLRALGENAWILRTRSVTGGLSLFIGLPLSRLMGAQGALIALVVSECLFAAAAWAHLARSSGGGPVDGAELEPEPFLPV